MIDVKGKQNFVRDRDVMSLNVINIKLFFAE